MKEATMELLNKDVREATKKRFEDLTGKVKILHFTQEPSRLVLLGSIGSQDCAFCKETKQLLQEVAGLSDKIDFQIFDFKADKDTAAAYGIDKIPATVIMGEEDYGIRIFGIPSGYEYQTLIDDIVDVSHRDSGLAEATRQALKAIDKDIRIQVFVTPTCPYCGIAVRLAHQFAMESPRIRGEMVESTEFPHISNKYKVYGVPKTIVNESIQFEGAVPEEVFLENVLKALKPEETK
jgi:glutaredoxin-like protein